LQKAVEVKEDDTAETLSARILEQEHALYVKAINLMLEGKYKIVERRTVVAQD
jgi:phosphoribosylglycinamide formyltransferase-1